VTSLPRVSSIDELETSTAHINFLAIADSYYSSKRTPIPLQDLVWAVRAVITFDHSFALAPDISVKFASIDLLEQLNKLGLILQVEGGFVVHKSLDTLRYNEVRSRAGEILRTLNM
jgi:hypothetical protein